MTLGLTGRSILKSLHEHGGTTTLTKLASSLNADAVAVERLLKSLLAAKLVCRTSDDVSLSASGRGWCAAEFKPKGDGMEAVASAPSSSPDEPGKQPPAISMTRNSPRAAPRKPDRMHGVQVVRVAGRTEQRASAPPAPVVSKPAVVEPRESEPTPPLVTAGESAAPATPRADQRSNKSSSKGVVVDRHGFVTHINGQKIY